MRGTEVFCVFVKKGTLELSGRWVGMQLPKQVCGREAQLASSRKPTKRKNEENVFASGMGVRAIATHVPFADSNNICISSGTQNDECPIDIGLHESEGLGGCTMKSARFNGDSDHCSFFLNEDQQLFCQFDFSV